MARNVEIKARARDLQRLHEAAARLAGQGPVLIEQVDTFFHAPCGRLKLRELGADRGELIHYRRPDQAGPKECNYSIVSTDRPAELRGLLAAALGVRGAIRKKRWLYLVGQTRIHLDEVDDLGQFLELEVVLGGKQTAEDGRQVATRIMAQLGVQKEDLVECAYIDLIVPGENTDQNEE